MFSRRLLYRTNPTCRWKMKPSLLAKATTFSLVMRQESARPRDVSSQWSIPPPLIRMNHLSLKVLPARKETVPGGLSVRLQNSLLSPKTWKLARRKAPKAWIACVSPGDPSFRSPFPLFFGLACSYLGSRTKCWAQNLLGSRLYQLSSSLRVQSKNQPTG